MIFEDFQALWLMDGHGIYVWTVYLFSIVFFLVLALLPIFKKRALIKTIRKRQLFAEQDYH